MPRSAHDVRATRRKPHRDRTTPPIASPFHPLPLPRHAYLYFKPHPRSLLTRLLLLRPNSDTDSPADIQEAMDSLASMPMSALGSDSRRGFTSMGPMGSMGDDLSTTLNFLAGDDSEHLRHVRGNHSGTLRSTVAKGRRRRPPDPLPPSPGAVCVLPTCPLVAHVMSRHSLSAPLLATIVHLALSLPSPHYRPDRAVG